MRLAFTAIVLYASIGNAQTEVRHDISGVVVDQQGQAVANIAVHGMAPDETFKTTTDAQGHFKLNVGRFALANTTLVAEDIPGKRIAVAISNYEKPFSADEPISITLQPARELPVSVLNADGDPSAATIVYAYFGDWPVISICL